MGKSKTNQTLLIMFQNTRITSSSCSDPPKLSYQIKTNTRARSHHKKWGANRKLVARCKLQLISFTLSKKKEEEKTHFVHGSSKRPLAVMHCSWPQVALAIVFCSKFKLLRIVTVHELCSTIEKGEYILLKKRVSKSFIEKLSKCT
jgi:hypothetical protein